MANACRRMMTVIMLAVATVALSACTQDLPRPELPDRLLMSHHGNDGRELDRQVINRGHPTHRQLQALLDRERGGWRQNFSSYIEDSYVFRSPSVIIRCYRGRIIVDYPGKSYSKQVDGVYRDLGLG